jgi:hypothetical protein
MRQAGVRPEPPVRPSIDLQSCSAPRIFFRFSMPPHELMPSGKRSSSRAGIVGTIYVIVIFSVVVQGLTNGIVLRCAVAAAE